MKKNDDKSEAPLEPKKNTARVKSIDKVQANNKIPIVGIGASAGGLEALEQFFGNMPADTGMAFVVIQHLDPNHKGIMPELLQRITPMKVLQVTDRLRIVSDHVYVIPPNKSMSVLNGMLHLFDPVEVRGLRLPIDYFLRSLAYDMHENAIGIILSGMGSDGSNGLKAIKEHSGLVLIQEPANAKFDGMPRSAIESVPADFVAPASELPEKLIRYIQHIPIIKPAPELTIRDTSSLEKIIILLRSQTGHDFLLYKKNTIYRRIERRMGIHQIERISSYVRFLQENPSEVEILFKELLIGVTNFFRDSLMWETMLQKILPEYLTKFSSGTILRAWVPGCSTGEEAYSLAIIFKEALSELKPARNLSLQIFATDLDIDAIEIARKGIFKINIASDVSPDRLSRFFINTDGEYRVNAEIREMVVFAPQNVIKDPPFTKLDIISCRNMLIYLESQLQNKLIALFHYSLNPGGILVLGSAETSGNDLNLFTPINNKLRIYQRNFSSIPSDLIDFPSSFSYSKTTIKEKQMAVKISENIQTLTEQMLLQQYAPASVLVNDKGDIIFINGRTGKYLEPAAGRANMNIFAMTRDGLRNEFSIGFRKALQTREKTVLSNIMIEISGVKCHFDVTIKWIEKPAGLKGMLIVVFDDLPELLESSAMPANSESLSTSKHQELEFEILKLKEDLQSTLEEMQTSQEELKSTNEELQSTNEELQSTNEELTTSKEELQSLNEELQTVNVELQSKVDDHARINNDMKNLLNSTEIATLFLDKNLHIRRFTNQATSIFKMIQSDIGRPFTDLVSDLVYPDMVNDANEVLRTLTFSEKSISSQLGRWYNVRIMPYRTIDDKIDGLVITLTDVTKAKSLELELNKTISILKEHNLRAE
jgi:two-component system CheB/CheR fusion protein